MRRQLIMILGVTIGLVAIPESARLASSRERTVRGTVVVDRAGQGQVGLPQVRVRCLGTDGVAHDDVKAPITDANGDFIAHIPSKYESFVLLFADMNNIYWPKQMELSPTTDPTRLARVILRAQTEALNVNERRDVERIELALAGSDPAIAQGLLARLNGRPAGIRLAEFTGAGAVFPNTVYSSWADAYKKETGVGLNYQSIGSGGGIKQIKARTVTFGASDMPLKADELKQAGLVQFPMLLGAIIPIVNLKGVGAGELTLDGATLAGIYMGEIKTWKDERIGKLNPKLALPDVAVAPVYRADGSGTNFLFTDYLAESSSRFRDSVGSSTAVKWPTGIGAKGNEGVANSVAQTAGSIGYVEYAYAKQNASAYVKLINASGTVVAPGRKTFQAAALNADWKGSPGNYVRLVNRPGKDAWPIVGASYILMYANPTDSDSALKALNFFSWAYTNGDGLATSLDFVPLPDSAKQAAAETWAKSITLRGRSVWDGTPQK